MRNLSDAVVLVVGASGGLGRAISASLAARGARLVLAGRDEKKLLEVPFGASRCVVAGDLNDPAFPAHAVQEAFNAYGRLDGVVSAAGVVAFGPLAETNDAVWEHLLAVNLLGSRTNALAVVSRPDPHGGHLRADGVARAAAG